MRKMKRVGLLWVVAAVAGWASGCRCSGDGQPGRTASPAQGSFALQNGLQADLLAQPCGDPAALVVLFAVGADHDPPERSGMARVAGRMLGASAPTGRAGRTVETGDDYTLYTVVVPGDRLLDELDDVAAWMARPTATQEALDRGRAEVLDAIGKRQGADAALTAASLAGQALRPAAGEGRRDGIAADVTAITLPELQAFWQSHVQPGSTRIAVTGRYDAAAVRARIQSAFGPLPAGTPPPPRPAAATSVRGTLVMGNAPSAVAIAVPAPAPSDPLFAPFLLAAGRLVQAPAPGRSWQARYDPIGRPDLLFVDGPVGPAEAPEPAVARIRAEVAAILAPAPVPEDVVRARQAFRLMLDPQGLDPAACAKAPGDLARAAVLRAQRHMGDPRLSDAMAGVTPDRFQEAAALFDARHSAAVIAGGDIL